MVPTEPPAFAEPRPFASLAELRDRHAELLRAVPTDELEEKHLDEVKEFLRRGAATGAHLDQPADRQAAQGLLDYWKATLYTQKRRAGTLRTPAAGGDGAARL